MNTRAGTCVAACGEAHQTTAPNPVLPTTTAAASTAAATSTTPLFFDMSDATTTPRHHTQTRIHICAGVVTEYLRFGQAEGGVGDVAQLDQLLRALQVCVAAHTACACWEAVALSCVPHTGGTVCFCLVRLGMRPWLLCTPL